MPPKPKKQCGNPLWLEWAKEITEEAEANDKGDTGYAVKTYAKACKSIAACPIPYSNLNELLSLQYVGKVMLSKLLKKQKEYYLARGMEIPANGGGGLGAGADDAQSVEAAPKASAATGGSSPKAPARSRAAVNNDESDPGEAGDSAFNMRLQAGAGSKRSAELEARRTKRQRLAEAGEDSDTIIAQVLIERQAQKKTRGGVGGGVTGGEGAAKKKTTRAKKVYVPERNSGAYALLVGLLLRLPEHLQQPLPPLNSTDPEAEDVREDHIMQHLMANHLTKSDLMNAASDHCRISMHTSENGHWATGWNAMKTLTTKELVARKGNPARYFLTREGYTCALGVWQATNAETGGFPAVTVPIEAMGGFQYALPRESSQAGPGPSTMANTAHRIASTTARPSMTIDLSCSRLKHPDTAYMTIIDDMNIQGDFPYAFDEDSIGQRETSSDVGTRHTLRGESVANSRPAIMEGGSGPSVESRTADGLQFWYISPVGERVKYRHEAVLLPGSAGLSGTMVQIEIPAKDLGHPLALRYQKWVQSHGLFFRGYILEETAPKVCAGSEAANMVAPDLLCTGSGQGTSNGRTLGIENHSARSSDLRSAPVPYPARNQLKSLSDPRRVQSSRSATDEFQMNEAQLLEDLFGTKKKQNTVDSAYGSLSRTTSMPAALPIPHSLSRRELGKQASILAVHCASMRPRRDDKNASVPGSSGNPRDVLKVEDLDFSPVSAPVSNNERRKPSFIPDPARTLASSPTPVYNDDICDIGSPPFLADNIDFPVTESPSAAPLFLPEDESFAAPLRAPGPPDISHPPNGASMRPAPITVPATRVSSAAPKRLEEDLTFDQKDAIIFEAGTYDIILVIDGREVKNKRDEDTLRKGLSEKGITVEVRSLNLGDMLWVAKSRLPEHRGDHRECVLDYVVERKRLDDLCHSIRDGRYDEQKFRLNNSCLRNVYYIVEQWNVGGYLGNTDGNNTTAQAVATARSQTQVTDGFFVKDTHNLSETIEYLRLLTEVIIETHQSAPIHIIPSRYISRSTYCSFQTRLRKEYPATPYYTTYEAFQELNTKAANRTLRETFARMLLCVKQMSSERVSASLNHWQTPRELHEWLKERKREFAAAEGQEADSPGAAVQSKGGKKKVRGLDMVFADTVQGEGRQKVGDQLSRDLFKIFG